MKNDIVDLAVLICALLGGVFSGISIGQGQQKSAAISAGVAEYVVNPQTGETKFQFKKP